MKFKISFIPFLLIFISGFFTQCTQEKKLNVLYIMTDDLNCNISAYDHYLVKTPNIDNLANEGMLFTNAFCNFPLCGPSRGSMMTGLYPDQTGHHALRDLIREHVPNVTTMSQVFMNNGYESTRVGKIYHYDNPRGIGTPGHDDSLSWSYRYYPKGRDKAEEDKIFTLVPGQFGATLSWMAADGTDEEQTDGMVATKSIELLKQYAEEDKPFFLAVGFYKPHTPYVAPKKYFEMYPKDKIKVPVVPEGYLSTLPVPAQKSLTRFKPQNNLPDSLARCAIQAYYATISFLDTQIGRVVNALKEYGLEKNTIIVFASDHGYHMGEHGYYQKKTLFEHSGRIPLIISYPDMKTKGQRTNSIVEMIDLYPTVCSLAGVTPPEYIAGKDMLPILEEPNFKIRESALTQIDGGYTIRTADYRYTKWKDGGKGMIEFYDRKADPAEMLNLANEEGYENIINELDKQLEKRIEEASVPPVGLEVIKNPKK